MRGKRNIRLVVAFDGTAYHGWQIQGDKPTIQGLLRRAIRQITGESVTLTGSGRTDSGTHARALVANFITASPLAPAQLARAINGLLPRDIRVLSAQRVPMGFHARRAARAKTYRYQIYRGPIMPPHLAREHYHYPYSLDLALMQRAAQLFVGEHDFASFAKKGGQSDTSTDAGDGPENAAAGCERKKDRSDRNTVRKIFRCELKLRGHQLHLTVEGSGFLHHMVRNMVGTLLELGRGRMTLENFEKLFEKRDRRFAGFTAPAHGLILLRVRY